MGARAGAAGLVCLPIGLREGTHTYVVFVEVGTDPASLPPRGQRRAS